MRLHPRPLGAVHRGNLDLAKGAHADEVACTKSTPSSYVISRESLDYNPRRGRATVFSAQTTCLRCSYVNTLNIVYYSFQNVYLYMC